MRSRMLIVISVVTYADIDGRHLKSIISEITAISLKSRASGDKMWGRIAGMSGEKMTNDWVERRLRRQKRPRQSGLHS